MGTGGRLRRRLAMFLAILAALTAAPAARACSCGGSVHRRTLLPADGTESYPTDGRIRVFYSGGWPTALREALLDEYRLRGPDGGLVPMRASLEGFVGELVPQALLEPSSTYTIERVFAYGGGLLLTDEQRWDGATDVVRVWYPEAAFQTGEGPDPRTPQGGHVTKAEFAGIRSSCGPGEALNVGFVAPEGLREGDVVGVEAEGYGVLWRAPHVPWPAELGEAPAGGAEREAHTDDGYCAPDKVHVDISAPIRVRAVAWTASGTLSEPGPWTRAVPMPDRHGMQTSTHGHEDRTAELGATTASQAATFASPPPMEPSGGPSPGPASCPFGLRPVATTLFTEHRWVKRGPRDRLAFAGQTGWLLVRDPDEIEASAVQLRGGADAGDVLVLGEPQTIESIAPADGDLPAVVVGRDPGRRVWKPCACGGAVWEVEFPTDFGPSAIVAVGGGRVFLAWTESREDPPGRWAYWEILDAETGVSRANGALPDSVSAIDAAWDGEAFAVKWSDSGLRVWMTRVRPDGSALSAVSLPAELAEGHLVAAGRGWVAAWAVPTGTAVARIDREGKVAAGPWVVGTAVLGGPARDLAVNGDLIAVVGGERSDWRIAVIDGKGVISASWELGDGRAALDAGVEPWREGFVVAYGVSLYPRAGWIPAVERLTCRKEAQVGPPLALPR